MRGAKTFASGFTKREFVIEIPDGKYPQMVKFEVVRDKINQLDQVSIGDEVKVTFDIRGNEYKGRYYVNLNAWKIEGGSGGGKVIAQGKPATICKRKRSHTGKYLQELLNA